jgi:dynein heavy chain, axonemal
VFPRFYFLANEDLLMLLAQTKDPRAVQPHMDKCFEGIQKVEFSDKEEVTHMISAEGETVKFDKMVDVNEGDKKGNVEKWMLEIETAMRKSLSQACKDSLHQYYNMKRTEWVKNWPGQIILAVDQIDWTTGVEDAIPKEDGLLEYRNTLTAQIEDIVQLVRGDMSNQLRTTLKAMVVIDVHARDVVTKMVEKNVQQANEFEWSSQLRYYW